MNYQFLLLHKLLIVGLISISSFANLQVARGESPLEDALIRQRDITNERLRQSQDAINQPSPIHQNVSEADLEQLKQDGLILLEQNQYKPAQLKFIEAYNLGARDASVYYYIGLTSFHLGENAQAVQAFTYALEQNPESIDSKYYRGSAYYNLNDNQAAYSDYTDVINKNPAYCAAWNSRGVVNFSLEKYSEAMYDYTKALNLSPESQCPKFIVLFNLGHVHNLVEEYQTAINYLDRAIQLKPDHADSWHQRGIAYRWINNSPQAINDYKKALEINPNHQGAIADLIALTTTPTNNSANSIYNDSERQQQYDLQVLEEQQQYDVQERQRQEELRRDELRREQQHFDSQNIPY